MLYLPEVLSKDECSLDVSGAHTGDAEDGASMAMYGHYPFMAG